MIDFGLFGFGCLIVVVCLGLFVCEFAFPRVGLFSEGFCLGIVVLRLEVFRLGLFC